MSTRTSLRATYRLQLHSEFGFPAATAVLPYLRQLGISHVYSSPCLQAAPGSRHGYDVVSPGTVNPELGGEPELKLFCSALDQAELGRVLDIVPNHMATGQDNDWWMDVLEHGPASRYAGHFDIDWNPPDPELNQRVLLPILGDHYARELESGNLKLAVDTGRLQFRYHEHRFPLAPESVLLIAQQAALRSGSPQLSGFAQLSEHTSGRAGQLRKLNELLASDAAGVQHAIASAIREVNQEPDSLHMLLERQFYRLAYWRTGMEELNYRRFFDIHSLVGIRMEQEHVFQETHERIVNWVQNGTLHGLPIDHPDGLRDPEAYLKRLQTAAPSAWIVVEKILHHDEQLPFSWPVAGTTGYDFLNRVSGLLIDPEGEEPLTRFYARFTGEERSFEAIAREKKLQMLESTLRCDLRRLASKLARVAKESKEHRDFTRRELMEAFAELCASFPVYRTYYAPGNASVRDADRGYVQAAIRRAKAERPDLDQRVFEFLERLLTLQLPGDLAADVAMRTQQFTGVVMAKGVEDTAFYSYNRFIALNEVGGDPGLFGSSPDAFHAAMARVAKHWPETMLATSTHDTKRSEDVRARLLLLSEIPEQWTDRVQRWAAMNESEREDQWPDRNTEYLFYQTLAGAWPISPERMVAYIEKACREAKTYTSWISPNPSYETRVRQFVESTMANRRFMDDVAEFVQTLIWPGRVHSLAQKLIQLTAPGIPDLYQGTELWDLSLVDPDNRRPVDYDLRHRLLAELETMPVEQVLRRAEEGLPKLWLIRQALVLRRERPDAFDRSSGYAPLSVRGPRSSHLFGFVRGGTVCTIVPRHLLKWDSQFSGADVELPPGRWRHHLAPGIAFDAGPIPAGVLFDAFPVALLVKEEK